MNSMLSDKTLLSINNIFKDKGGFLMNDTISNKTKSDIAKLVFTLNLDHRHNDIPYDKEVLTICQDEGRLSIDQYVSDNIIRSCQYHLANEVNEMLMILQKSIDTVNFVTIEEDVIKKECDKYQLEIEYYSNAENKHSGLYDCWQVSVESLIALIKSVDDVFTGYNSLSMFDVHAYLNINDLDRVKYCSVLLPLGDELYYYQTDDDSIEKEDRVLVLFGVNETEMEGVVKETKYYALDEVPFPLHKTKEIIRKL